MGPESAGKATDAVNMVAATEGGAKARGVTQQPLAQTWQAVGCSAEADAS